MAPIGTDTRVWPPPSAPHWDSGDPPAGATADAAGLPAERPLPRGFIEWFAVAQTAIPALLFLPGSQVLRLPIRVGVYVLALAAFGVWWLTTARRDSARHPAEAWLMLVTACLFVMIFHPLTNSPQAGVAQTLLYFSVFCSVFWVPAFVTHPRQLVRLLAILLVCNGLNAVVGVLQVYDPDRWMPPQLSSAFESDIDRFMASTYVGPDGRRIVRPPGLFDTPGAVCGPGTIAALLGLVFALARFEWWKRALALAFALAGVAAIYLSHVRANLVVLVIMLVAYGGLLLIRGQSRRLSTLALLAAGLLVVGLGTASALGGDSIGRRFASLLDEDPREVYYASRGRQVAYAFNSLAVDYPAGAGLGRWGMMRGYFGDPSNLDSSALWAEVQPNAWILDGGWFLLVLYALALAATALYQWRLVRSLTSRDDIFWSATVVAVNVGTMALVFSFVPFTTQVGLQFWFLEGVLHGAMLSRPRA